MRHRGKTHTARAGVRLLVSEGLVAVGAALLITYLARFVDLNPMSRIGQVSGLAALQLQLLLLLGVILLICVPAMRRWADTPLRFAAGGVAGLSSGITAAGISLALRDTNWPLNGQGGDSGALQAWAGALMQGKPLDGAYPPMFPHLIAWTAEYLTNGDVGYAMKLVGLLFMALLGPVAYLAWRLLLPPLWALGIGVTASLPMMQPYKPYTNLVLVALVPVLGKLIQVIQRSAELPRKRAALQGGALGLLIGLLFMLYSGWFVWSALGVIVLSVAVVVRTWRDGGTRALVTAGTTVLATSVVFFAVAGSYLVRLLSSAGSTVDRYCYFDTYVEPTYFAMWRDDLPGTDAWSTWPLPGELGGVGIFSIVLLVGLGFALALGINRPSVLVTAACAASALVMRYWYAAHMERDQAVMLYPRTSAQLLYCTLVLTGLACYLAARRWGTRRTQALENGQTRVLPRFTPRAVAMGALCALGLLYAMAGSATADRFMPNMQGDGGDLAWYAQSTAGFDGHCSKYAPDNKCSKPGDLSSRLVPGPDQPVLGCPTANPYPARPKATGMVGTVMTLLAD
ncbi:hypothetical protein [Streptomyces sp. CB01881]|uniref:hypothetical protein n=1 Tax=Streptomyces sp. CB01881 TaxID=2078691 RepID=UPI000CDC880F|nr:hypothetical protein [Streptomyces sp. CB01881]AUY51320.1 hypothetical protein C2142_22955 [Streptomyces sp. CB01881]TYC74707.1 hypothetical protein EH183_22930 [Streptomyces sp. CB01881]